MKKICALIFLVFLSVFFVGVIVLFPWQERLEFCRNAGGGFGGIATTVMDTLKTSATILSDNIVAHDQMIQIYGGAQRVMGVDDVPDGWDKVTRLKNGALTFTYEKMTPFNDEEADSIRKLSECAEALGAQKLFVVMPQKSCRAEDSFACRGIVDVSEDIDAYRRAFFEDAGYATLDLHDKMHAQNFDHLSLYFRTDHHWKMTTGLWAAGEITEALGMSKENYAPDRYTVHKYDKFFLGSEGKRLGSLYCGADDLEMPEPKFRTKYVLDIPDKEIHKEGDFMQTLFFEDELRLDYFHATPYRILLKGDHPLLTIRNEMNPDGQKALLIKDSFSDCVAPYLAASFEELVLVDPRYYQDSITELFANGNFDVLLIGQSTRADNSVFCYS